MKKSVPIVVLTSVMLCLLLTDARAQNTLAYATVDYDEETNTIYGYAYTEPDYAAGPFYHIAHVGAKLRDADNTELAVGSNQNYGRAELNLQASGNGNGPYKIQSGHYVFLSYYVSNYWDSYAYQYRTGYLDYNYYSYFTSGGPGFPVFDIPNFFDFLGRSPQAVRPSVNIFLGTLLSEFVESVQDRINFTTAKVGSNTVNFNSFGSAEMSLNENQCFGGASNNSFTLTLDYILPAHTTHVFKDSRSLMPYDDVKDQYQQSGPLQITEDLSGTPKPGRASITIFRKRPSEPWPNTKVRIIIAGRLGGGGSFSSAGRVKFNCP